MTVKGKIPSKQMAAGVIAAVFVALSTPASAEGLFQRFFSDLSRVFEGPSRAVAPPPVEQRAYGYAEPGPANNRYAERVMPGPQNGPQAPRGPAQAFCVRTCDGHYFPVRAHAGLSVAEACNTFCPASETRVYSGSNIDYAVARDGARYASLKTAYAYRKALVPGCTCNGRDPFGLAHIDATKDPTLRPGDVVATADGLVAYTGRKDQAFTPVENYARFSKRYRETLSDLEVRQNLPQTQPVDLSADTRREARNQSGQITR